MQSPSSQNHQKRESVHHTKPKALKEGDPDIQKQPCQSSLLNQEGSLSFVGLALVLMMSTYFLTVILNQKQRNLEAKERTQVYLCAKEALTKEEKHLKHMALLNKSLLASYLLMKSPIPAVAQAAKASHEALKLSQTILHVSHVKQLSSLTHCHSGNRAQWAIQTTYGPSPLLKRGITGQAIAKVDKCQYVLFPNIKRVRPSTLFVLQVKRENKAAEISWQTKEASLNLKSSFGSLSYSQLLSHSKKSLNTTITN